MKKRRRGFGWHAYLLRISTERGMITHLMVDMSNTARTEEQKRIVENIQARCKVLGVDVVRLG